MRILYMYTMLIILGGKKIILLMYEMTEPCTKDNKHGLQSPFLTIPLSPAPKGACPMVGTAQRAPWVSPWGLVRSGVVRWLS